MPPCWRYTTLHQCYVINANARKLLRESYTIRTTCSANNVGIRNVRFPAFSLSFCSHKLYLQHGGVCRMTSLLPPCIKMCRCTQNVVSSDLRREWSAAVTSRKWQWLPLTPRQLVAPEPCSYGSWWCRRSAFPREVRRTPLRHRKKWHLMRCGPSRTIFRYG